MLCPVNECSFIELIMQAGIAKTSKKWSDSGYFEDKSNRIY